MVRQGQNSPISLEGEVVQILERKGGSSLRVIVRHLTVLDISAALVDHVHLGDRIALDGSFRVEAVRPLPDEEAP